jgi:hypothetical protein
MNKENIIMKCNINRNNTRTDLTLTKEQFLRLYGSTWNTFWKNAISATLDGLASNPGASWLWPDAKLDIRYVGNKLYSVKSI